MSYGDFVVIVPVTRSGPRLYPEIIDYTLKRGRDF